MSQRLPKTGWILPDENASLVRLVDLNSLQLRDTMSSSNEKHDDTFHEDGQRRLGIANVSFLRRRPSDSGEKFRDDGERKLGLGSAARRLNVILTHFNATLQRRVPVYGAHVCRGNAIATSSRKVRSWHSTYHVVDCIVAAFENVALVYISYITRIDAD